MAHVVVVVSAYSTASIGERCDHVIEVTIQSRYFVRGLGEQDIYCCRYHSLARPDKIRAGFKPVEAKYRNTGRNRTNREQKRKGKRKGWVRRKQLNDNVY